MLGRVFDLFSVKAGSLDQMLLDYGRGNTKAGISVGTQDALGYAPVWQAVQMISGDVSKTRRSVYRRLPDMGPEAREKDTQHPAQKLVARYANERQSAKRFWNTYVFHFLFWHNSYAWIKRAPTNSRPLGLYQLRPDRTGYDKETNMYVSEIGEGKDAELYRFRPEDILHCQGFQTPTGEPSLMRNARESWAVGIAAQQHSSKFFASDCLAGGVLEIPANFSKKGKDVLQQGFEKKYKGQAFQTVILRDGAKFHQLQIDAEKSQMSETRTQQAREVASWFNIPPSRLGIPDSGGYGSRAEDNANYFHQTIDPIFAELEGELDLKLLTRQQRDRDSHYFDHDEFIRLDRKTKAEIGKIEYEMGSSNPDEYRMWVGKNPRPDGKGGEFVQPNANHVPVESGETEEATDQPEDMAEEIDAMANEISKQSSKKHETRFVNWLDKYAESDRVKVLVSAGFDYPGLVAKIKNNLSDIERILDDVRI